MRRRCLSLWLPDFPIDRARLRARRRGLPFPDPARPLALWRRRDEVGRLVAVNAAARRLGIRPGTTVTDARAILPRLRLLPHDPEADERALAALGHWCRRFTPLPALDPPDGLLLDVTGCAHLFGGEEAMCAELARRLRTLGFTVRIGIADGRLAARAWTRFGEGGVLAGERRDAALRALPLAALDIDGETLGALLRLGFRRVGELAGLPRAGLLRRFGTELAGRLDALLGDAAEPFRPLAEPPAFSVRLDFPEPVGRREDLEAVLDRLLADLEGELERAEQGVRRLVFHLLRLDGGAEAVELALGRPMRRARDLAHLFRLRLDRIDPGFGFETAILDAVRTAPLPARQAGLLRRDEGDDLVRLVESLRQRFGPGRVLRFEPVASHVPERAMRTVDAARDVERADWLAPAPRPLTLFADPPRIETVAPLPDGPPAAIRRGGRTFRVVRAAGPERILPEWWRADDEAARPRDFHELIDDTGARLWVCREGSWGDPEPPVWRLVGHFD